MDKNLLTFTLFLTLVALLGIAVMANLLKRIDPDDVMYVTWAYGIRIYIIVIYLPSLLLVLASCAFDFQIPEAVWVVYHLVAVIFVWWYGRTVADAGYDLAPNKDRWRHIPGSV